MQLQVTCDRKPWPKAISPHISGQVSADVCVDGLQIHPAYLTSARELICPVIHPDKLCSSSARARLYKRAIPAIAFGTGTELFGCDAMAYVVQALKGGFNHIDTAQAYGNEESVGEALRVAFGEKKDVVDEKIDIEGQVAGKFARDDVWVTTKYRGVDDAETALDTSLEKLRLSYVDLYLIHAPSIVPDILTTWSELERAQKNGKAKFIGVSNLNIELLKLILERGTIVPAVNQILLHPYNYHEQAELLEFSKAHGILIESYGGLKPITKLPGRKLDDVLDGIAKRLGSNVTPAQIIMSWIHAKGVVIVTTSSRKERIQEYLDVLALPRLTAEDIVAIDEAGKHPPSTLRGQRHLIPKQSTAWLTALVTVAIVVILFYIDSSVSNFDKLL